MSDPRPWHRLFGLSLIDFFRGTPVQVELEKDLSLRQQLLDVVILRKGAEPLPRRLPDGFEDLAAHNLVTFKSYQEALDGWALDELVGHYVNYRKQAGPSVQELPPEADFRRYAVCVRTPLGLLRQGLLVPVGPGVYEARHFTGVVRVVVVHELPQEENNALLHLFSARADLLRYGSEHYRMQSRETSTLLADLFKRYRVEATLMPDLLQEFVEQKIREILKDLPAEKRVEGLSADELLAALSPEVRAALVQRLQGGGARLGGSAGEPEADG